MKPIRKYLLLCNLSATSAFDGGILHVAGKYVLKFVQLTVLLLVWRSLPVGGADSGTTLSGVLTYTLLSSLLSEQLGVITPATTDFGDGTIIARYIKPMPVLLQFTAETAGRWLPSLLLYSLPMFLAAPLLGVNPLPASPESGLWFVPSFVLAISLGFAMDFLFASMVIYMKNASYTAYVIRQAVTAIFSGALIPFVLLPWGIGNALSLLPFASTAGAPLSIYTGSGDILQLIALQLFWNAVLWAAALLSYKNSEERMVSYGG